MHLQFDVQYKREHGQTMDAPLVKGLQYQLAAKLGTELLEQLPKDYTSPDNETVNLNTRFYIFTPEKMREIVAKLNALKSRKSDDERFEIALFINELTR